jgi:hypothetical protein
MDKEMIETYDEIKFSRKTWELLKSEEYFREVMEVLEDIESLEKAKSETEYFVDYEDYRKERLAKINV